MKKFSTITMPLYNSNKANFKIDLKARFVKQDQNKQYRDLVYVGEKYEAIFNPSMYLALSCKIEGTKEVYIGYPQFRKLRKIMGTISDLLEDNKGFIEVDGVLSVNATYAEPLVINNIGQDANWISFKLQTFQSDEEEVEKTQPGVAIGLSTANNYVAVLSAQEFWTIETILNEINLTQFKWNASLAYLDIDYQGNNYYAQPGQYYQQPVAGYVQPQPNPNRYYQQPQQYQQYADYNNSQAGGYQKTYAYNTQPAQPVYNQAPYQKQYAQRQQPAQQQPAAEENNFIKPQQPMRTYQQVPQAPKAPVAQQQEQQLPPRENTPRQGIMNFNSVEQTPISEVSIDDDAAVNAIFGDDAAGIFGN